MLSSVRFLQAHTTFIALWMAVAFAPSVVNAAEADAERGTGTTAAADRGFAPNQRIALVGNSTAERMNLYGNLETRLHARFPDRNLLIRNFGWPADAVDVRQRPGNYTKIDNPFVVFDPEVLVCFFGLNESFDGDSPEQIERFQTNYRKFIDEQRKQLGAGDELSFVLVSPMAFEDASDPLHPDGKAENRWLRAYRDAVKTVADQAGHRFVDLFEPTRAAFDRDPGLNYTINGIHADERGDVLIAAEIERQLFGDATPVSGELFERMREIVIDKSWLHLQDYRMLNGWYVYGGRRTWDTETFPTEYRKIREMVRVRDEYLWRLASGQDVPPEPDDSRSGEVFIPETMFGSRDDNFRSMREPRTLDYPTPEQSIAQMKLRDGFEVECFASEADFPELANPTQIAFDSKNRLWVSCMVNYPQWLPGKARPDDRLLIFEDEDNDGKADRCKVFYDQLICPTGFEFFMDGVLVVDEPRILFLRDTDGDDVADEVTHVVDGIATDDTHHAMGAWEYSPDGLLHMLEGIAMSTTIETPYGPRRQSGASGAYVWDFLTSKLRHFRTPGQANPWCLVWDHRGNGIVGDGTNANQHWANLFSGGEVRSRGGIDAIFNNHGIRPAAGNEFLRTRQFPESCHDELIYACVINLHGMPAFTVGDDDDTAGLVGSRTDDLIESTDMFFRPVDPKIGPDGTLYFGDWCNALIGHMQYSQRDPNRDHMHGRIYRLKHRERPLVEPLNLADASVPRLLEELTVFEPRTRYRVRRELRSRKPAEVLSAIDRWLETTDDSEARREALWVQSGFHRPDSKLVETLLSSSDRDDRCVAVHMVGNQADYLAEPLRYLRVAATDPDPRVRLECARSASMIADPESVRICLSVAEQPMDKWVDYVVTHSLQALEDVIADPGFDSVLASLPKNQQMFLRMHQSAQGPGAAIRRPLMTLMDVDAKAEDRDMAMQEMVAAKKGDRGKGKAVFNRVCSACHQYDNLGKKFGPNLTGLGDRMTKEHIVRSILYPNEEISKGYETVQVLDVDGVATVGFVLSENDDEIVLGVADGKTKTIAQDDIEVLKEMKASSMPEALIETISPNEFLDLLAFLMGDWVATNPNLDYGLQKHDEWTEVSRQTHLKLGKDFPPNLNVEAEHLLSHEGVRKNAFAFHSPNGKSEQTAVVIRFNDPTRLRHMHIRNRREEQFHDRAKGIRFFVSDDGENWKQLWSAEDAEAEWSVDLPADTVAKYAKFDLDRPGIFHLDRVVMFGEVLEPEPTGRRDSE